MDKHQLITGGNTLVKESIDSLINKREELINDNNKSKVVEYSKKAGIISFSIDGLEEIYGVSKIEELEPNDFKIIEQQKSEIKNNDLVKLGDSVCKIINGYKWYVMVKVDINEFSELKENENLYIRINDDSRKIKSKIHKINKSKEEMLIIFELDDYCHEFYNERYIDVKIIKDTYKGLMIPNDTIFEKDGLKGVHIKGISGIVKFRPIKIIGANDEYTIVSEGQNKLIEVETNGNAQKMYTIQLFDEVYLNGHKVEEGQIVN